MHLFNRIIVILSILLIFINVLQAKAEVTFSIFPVQLKAGEKGVLKATFKIPEGMHQTYQVGDEEYFFLNGTCNDLKFEPTSYPDPHHKLSESEWEYKGTFTLTKPFVVKPSATEGIKKVLVEAGYNICFDNGMCEAPETVNKTLTIQIKALPNSENKADTTQLDTTKIAPPVSNVSETSSESKSKSNNIWKYLLLAFLGGLILNVMPCVLPVLSIKAMSIIKQAHDEKGQIVKHSFAYMGGIILSFVILASIIVILKSLGEVVGWGFQFQNTNFVMFLISLIFVFALSLFDVFIINLPGMNTASQASSKSGIGGSFLSGVFAVLLATPCSAPLLGTALGFAFSQPAYLIFIFFILIGFGLAFPFFLLGLSPRWMKYIPKPGEWMNIFKEIMGFLLIGTMIWLLHVVYQQNGGEYLLNTIIYLTFLAFAVWLYGRFVRYEYSKLTQWIFTLLAILIVVGAALTFLPIKSEMKTFQSEEYSQEKGFEGWLNFRPGLVEELVAQGHPVFVDFGAKWCMTCITNEKTVITTKDMRKLFDAKKVKLVRGDFTKKNEAMSNYMKHFGRAGVPFNMLFIPGEKPVLFPELITFKMIKDELEKIK